MHSSTVTPLTAMPRARPAADPPPSNCQDLFSFAYVGPVRSTVERREGQGAPDKFDRLVQLAAPENWDGLGPRAADSLTVLKNCVRQAFDQALEQDAISRDTTGQHCVFNTGLVTEHNEDIYSLFEPNRLPDRAPWFLTGWRTADSVDLQTFGELPGPPVYSADPFEFCFEWGLPLSFSARPFSREISALLPASGQEMPYGLELALNAAVADTLKRARLNPGYAVPIWNAPLREVQFLLPLYVATPQTPTAALAVSRGDNSYRGAGLLSLEEAYIAARLITRPNAHWLHLPAPTPIKERS